jgi:hypothetical protein
MLIGRTISTRDIKASTWPGIHPSMLLRIKTIILKSILGCIPDQVLALILKSILGCIPDQVLAQPDDKQIDPFIFFCRTRGALRFNSRMGKH